MIGQDIGNYRVTGKLGEGGMGVVYLAEHRSIGRKAAIKVLLPELSRDAAIVQRFFNEARATAMIKHPGMVDIFDFGTLPDGSAFIAMEFLDGQSLAAAIEAEGRMPLSTIVAIGRQAAAALAAAHDKGIVHRDLKPDNMFLLPDAEASGGARVKVLDFGIAKLAAGNADGSGLKTRTGVMMGTPIYMSPEQAKSAGEVDYRSDIYSLGCVLYEMACGRPPFVKESFGELIAAHIFEVPEAPRSLVPEISEGLETLLLRALAKKPEQRQQSMGALRIELDALVGSRGTGETPILTPRSLAVAAPSGSAIMAVAPTPGPEKLSTPGASATRASASMLASTTLGSTASEIATAYAKKPSRSGVIALFAGVVLVGGGAAVMFGMRGPAPTNKALRIESVAVPVVAPVAVPVVAPVAVPTVVPTVAAAAAPAITTVKLTIDSAPPGATILRASDQRPFGVTPSRVEVDRAPGMVNFTLSLPGYHSSEVRLSSDHDGAATAKLTAVSHSSPSRGAGEEENHPAPVKSKSKQRMDDATFDPFK